MAQDTKFDNESLLCALTVSSSLQMQDLLEEVDSDPGIQQDIQDIVQGKNQKKHYSIIKGRLFYKGRLVIPKTSKYIVIILQEYHDGVFGGHSGVLKTIKRIQRLFHWSKLKDDVQHYVSECTICQTHKYSTLNPGGLLQPIPLPTMIWSEVSMDFIDGLPKAEGFSVIMVVVDRLSKYAHFIPLKHPYTATSVAEKFIREIVRLHGYPVSIISDRDRVFLSKFWKECFRLAGTALKFSTAYHPQSDGQTEVVNRCLEAYLRCFTSANPKQWSKYLSWCEYWYNTSYHTSTHTSPFKLVYGREPPSLLQYEEGSTLNFELEVMLKERDEMLRQAKEFLVKAQAAMKDSADKHRRDLQFSVGSSVFLKLRPYRQKTLKKTFCRKLAAKYYGPFTVLERIGPVAYRLQLPDDCKIHPVFHVSQLKPVLGKNHIVTELPSTLNESAEFVLQPEALASYRYDDEGFLEVSVQWKGLPVHEISWMRVKDLKRDFPEFELEDKLGLIGGGNDKPWRVYYRKKKEAVRREEENKEVASADVD